LVDDVTPSDCVDADVLPDVLLEAVLLAVVLLAETLADAHDAVVTKATAIANARQRRISTGTSPIR
jgi:hypothetical protein